MRRPSFDLRLKSSKSRHRIEGMLTQIFNGLGRVGSCGLITTPLFRAIAPGTFAAPDQDKITLLLVLEHKI